MYLVSDPVPFEMSWSISRGLHLLLYTKARGTVVPGLYLVLQDILDVYTDLKLLDVWCK